MNWLNAIRDRWQALTLIFGIFVAGAYASAEAHEKLEVLETTAEIAESNADTLAVIVYERELEAELKEQKDLYAAQSEALMAEIARLQARIQAQPTKAPPE